ncbi:glycosyltransferase family 2 protein [Patescibacteria group bacterium]|nr:glycosyltransferase family 2 protein [Patescibacteria group bacterium]MBU2543237.1 glycosyltransferase family 2 protein [Patescibacteria group bacterium]
MDHISIILVNYNSAELTKMCLKSLQNIRAKDFSYCVIIVDNASQKLLKLPKSLQADHVEVIRSESNLGFSGGNNLGITYAAEHYNPDYICLLNNDTTVEPNFLEHLYNYIKDKKPGCMVTPKIYFAKGFEYHKEAYPKAELGNVIWYAGGSIDWPNLIAFHRGVDEIDRGHLDVTSLTDFCTGCCILISREVLETVGMLDDKLFLYYEDADLSLRAGKKGFQVLYCPDAVIWHHNAGSSGGAGSPLHTYYQTRNRVFIGLKYGSPRVKLTAVSYALRTLMNGNPVERKAVTHALTGKMGKQPYDKI